MNKKLLEQRDSLRYSYELAKMPPFVDPWLLVHMREEIEEYDRMIKELNNVDS